MIVKTDGSFAALMITYIRDSDPSIFSNNNADVDIYFVILYSVIFIHWLYFNATKNCMGVGVLPGQ